MRVRSRRLRTPGILHLLLALGLTGCSEAPLVTVNNQSSVVLSNVVLSGAGFTNRLHWIPAGTTRTQIVHPTGESSLRVGFTAPGQSIDTNLDTYFEPCGYYGVWVTVDANLNVAVRSGSRLRR